MLFLLVTEKSLSPERGLLQTKPVTSGLTRRAAWSAQHSHMHAAGRKPKLKLPLLTISHGQPQTDTCATAHIILFAEQSSAAYVHDEPMLPCQAGWRHDPD